MSFNLERRLRRLEDDAVDSELLTFTDVLRLVDIVGRVERGLLTKEEGDAASLQISEGKRVSDEFIGLLESVEEARGRVARLEMQARG